MVDLIRQVLLALLSQQAESCAADDPAYHIEVTAYAAVYIIQDHTFLSHVVFDDNDAIGAQALLTASQEVSQVLIRQVTWGEQKYVCTCMDMCPFTGPARFSRDLKPLMSEF